MRITRRPTDFKGITTIAQFILEIIHLNTFLYLFIYHCCCGNISVEFTIIEYTIRLNTACMVITKESLLTPFRVKQAKNDDIKIDFVFLQIQ